MDLINMSFCWEELIFDFQYSVQSICILFAYLDSCAYGKALYQQLGANKGSQVKRLLWDFPILPGSLWVWVIYLETAHNGNFI